MKKSHRIITGVAACIALSASAVILGWLVKSSEHPDRPPMFALVAFLLAVAVGASGLVLGSRAAKG
jgi:hypothetical protein